MHLKIYLFLLCALFSLNASGQNIIKGIITDAESGETIIGAGVSVKGTVVSTITDIDGSFQIQANKGDFLIVDYVGYKTIEIPVTSQSEYNISLKLDNIILDQVVVVGYGTQRKVDVTGATVSVKGEDLA